MPELPRLMAARFVADYGLPEYDATTLTQSKAMGACSRRSRAPPASRSWRATGSWARCRAA
jgi:aspartyl-tRNA(Asn)/glutamyl-tRNA(Gln) amidotransferase subunit B